jgi:hypothetical protein
VAAYAFDTFEPIQDFFTHVVSGDIKDSFG